MLFRVRFLGQATILLLVVVCLILLSGWREVKPLVVVVPSPHLQPPPQPHPPSSLHLSPEDEDDSVNTEQQILPEQEVVPLDPRENDLLYRPPLEVAFIFTHARDSYPLQNKLRVAVSTLLAASSAPLRLHLITDQDGFHIASQIIRQAQETNQLDSRYVKLVYVSADDFIPEIEDSVTILQEFFTRRTNAYYRDALFFFSLHLHKLLQGLDRVILMDIDIKVKGDIAELHSHFERFSPSNVIGMTLEQSSVYRHVLSAYRKKHPNTTFGSPPTQGGFPGFNSGVVLVDINKLRKSDIIRKYLSKSKLREKTTYYSFQGHLGDQDLYTMIALDHPELFYTIPCGWNRQLCTWWRDHGYRTVFDQYFNCTEEFKILHGNCKTPIPDDL
ncbi:xyloside xylosyltransferase 1-like [Homarus americanus]|uniref:Xyloside xylosyltransferase 1-like n=1 Tax=Homarus americanus TaxID=6706 RepID=A0A8J5TV87_HOMAM|nr:xyloside xylosyltransferase 1-like [Homarus americanus]KAG7177737.1 Xyloside xylosyltransferase 1-like [Homarus americanus]